MKDSTIPLLAWALALAILVASVLWLEPSLPMRVASHFDLAGHPNGWAPRSREGSAFLAIAIATSVLMAAFGFAFRFLPPSVLNVPHPAYWRSAGHYPEACAVLRSFFFWLGALMALWFACLHGLIVRANRAAPPHLDGLALAGLTAAYIAAIAVLVLQMRNHFREVPAGPSD